MAVGGAQASGLNAKADNTIGQSNKLFEIYTPVQLASVRQANKARAIGWARLKKNEE